MRRDPRDVIIRPIITEKTQRLQMKHNQYTFEVHPRATKPEIRSAIQELFKVHVENVQVSWVKPKPKRLGFRPYGKTRRYKKAVVRLREGESIPIGGL